MAEILSQSEIDELLRALADNEEPEARATPAEEKQQVKPYDFKTANRFSKDNMRAFHTIFEYFARLLVSYISSTLRSFCEVSIESVEEVSFGEFTNSLPSPVVLGIVSMRPLKGFTLLKMPASISYAIINRLFGGSSEINVEESSDTNKEFTEIDMVIMERVMQQFMGLFSQSWERVEALKPYLQRTETSVQFTQLVPLNEPTALITLECKLGETAGLINFCIPYVTIQPIIKKLNSKVWFAGSADQPDTDYKEPLTDKLETTQVTMYAMFNETEATVYDILRLQEGDVIRLSHGTKEPIHVMVENIPKFEGVIGTYSSRYAIQVHEIHNEEEATDE